MRPRDADHGSAAAGIATIGGCCYYRCCSSDRVLELSRRHSLLGADEGRVLQSKMAHSFPPPKINK